MQFSLLLISAAVLAFLLPATGTAGRALSAVTSLGVAVLFFLHGARISREALKAGASNVRLQAGILATTFVIFPLLTILLRPVMAPFVGEAFLPGLLFLSALPSTVQSAIAVVSLARGNVAAAVCAASLSSAVGLVVTPALVGVLLRAEGAHVTPESVLRLFSLMLLPFAVGHLLRPWLAPKLEPRERQLKWVDMGSILLLVYGAFSHAVEERVFAQVTGAQLAALLGCVTALLLAVLGLSRLLARALGLGVEDEIALMFCGSKKGLTSGLPVAHALFPGGATLVVLPVMLFHQVQLLVCSLLARRYAAR